MGLVSDLFQEYTQDIPEPTVDASAHWMPAWTQLVNTGPGTHQSVAGNLGKTPEIRARFDQMNPNVPEPTVNTSSLLSWLQIGSAEGTHQQAAGNLGKTPQQRAAFSENARQQEILNRTYEDYGAESPVDEVMAIAAESQVRQQQQQEAGNLAQFAQGFGEATTFGMAPTLGREAATAVSKSGATFASMIARGLGSDYYADKYAREANLIEGATEEIRQEDSLSPWLSRIYGGTLTSLLQIAPGVASGGGVAPIIASAAGGEYTSAAQEARDVGLSAQAAQKYALEQGVIEGGITAGFQMMGLGGLESAMTKKAASNSFKQLAKTFAKQTGQELPEELTIEYFHNISRAAAGIDPNADNYETQLQTAIDTTAQTVLTMGLVNSRAAFGLAAKNKNDRTELAEHLKRLLPYVQDDAARTVFQQFIDSPSRQNLDKAKPVYDEWVKTPAAQAAADTMMTDQVDSVLGPAEAPETQQEAPQQPQPTPEPQTQPEAVTEPPVPPESVPEPPTEQGQFEGVPADPAKAVDARVLQEEQNPPQTVEAEPAVESQEQFETRMSKTAFGGTKPRPLGERLAQKLPDDVSAEFSRLPAIIRNRHGIGQLGVTEDSFDQLHQYQMEGVEGARYSFADNTLTLNDQAPSENKVRDTIHEIIASWAFNNNDQDFYQQWRKAAFPQGEVSPNGFSDPEQADQFARTFGDYLDGNTTPELKSLFDGMDERFASQPVVQEEAKKPEKIRVVRGTPTRNWQDRNPETGDIWWFAVDDNPSAIDSAAKTFAAKSYTFADPDIDKSLVAPTVTEADIEVTKSYEGTPEQEAELRPLLTANKAVQDEASGYKPIDEYVSETLNTWKTGWGDFSTATLNVLREQGYDSIRYPEDDLDTIGVLNTDAVKKVIKTHKVNTQTAQIEEQPYQTGQPITTRVVRLDNKKEGRTGRVFWTIGEDADLTNYQGDEVRGEVTLQNPLVVDGSQAELLRQIGRPEDADSIDARKVGIHKFDDEIKKEIASRGHDGIVYLDDTEQGAYQIVAFNPESVTEDKKTVADTEGEAESQPPSNSYKVTKSDAGFTVTFGGQKPQTFKTEREARDAGKKMSREAFAKEKVDAIKADALAGRLKPLGTTQLMRIAKNMLKMAGTKYMLRALEGGYCGNHPLAKSLGKMNYSDTDNDVQITVRSDFEEGARLTKDEVVAHEIGHAVDALNGEKRRTLDEMKGVPQGRGRARSYPVSLADRVAGRSTSTTKSGTKARKEQDAVIRSELESVAEKRNGEKLSRKAKSDSELIADFISAILTDPQMVMKTAPESYKVFWENVDTRKAFFPAYAEFHSSEQQQEVQETTEKPVGDQVVPGFFVQKVGSRKWRLRDSSGFIDNTYPSRKTAVQAAKDAKSQISRTDPDKILPETTEQQPHEQQAAKQFKGAGVKGRGKRRSKATAELVKEYGVSEQDVDSAIEQASEYLQDEEDNRIRPLRRRIGRSYKDPLTFRKIVKGDIQDAASLPGFDQVADTISEDVGFNQNMTGQQLYDWIRSLDIEYDTRNQTYNANHPRVIEEARKILDSATTTPTEQDDDISFDPATFEDPESPYFMNTQGVGRGTREEVYGPEEEPSDPTPSTPPVTKGGKKLMNDLLRSKGNKSTRTLAGIRNIGEFVAELGNAIVLLGTTQTSKRSPAHYIFDERRKGARKSPSVIRSRGPEGMFLFHEAGHAIDVMLSSRLPKDKKNNWWGKKDTTDALIALTQLPGSFASAKNRAEGIAEFIRLYIVDPGRIPTSLRNQMESSIVAVDPRIMQGIQDARRAFREWSSWSMADALQSINRSGKKGKTGLEGMSDAAWWAAYHIFGPNVALTRMNRKLWNPILKSLQGYGEALMKSVEGTAADADPMYQSLVRVQSETNTILYDDKSANRGIRVFASEGNPFSELTEEAVEALEELGLDIPTDAARSGNYIYLTDFSFQDIRDSIGEDNWNLFETYGQYKAALERYRVKGHAFPGMFDKKPADIDAWVEQVEQENPLFKKEFKRVQKFFDQLLLTGMMSGEFSLNEVINIKKQWKDYWPLLRKDDEGKVLSRGAPESPSSGVRRAFGSHERFRSLNEAAAYRVSSALQSYYRLRAMKAVKNMAEVVAGNLVVATHEDGRKMLINRIQMQNNKDFQLPDGFTLDATADAHTAIPWEVKTEAARVMLPLSTEKGLAATLTEGDEAKIVLKAIKEMQAQGAIGLDPDEDITIEDIAIYTPGGTQIFRGKKPKAVRVIRMFENGENKYYQITDDMLFDMFAHGSYTPNRVMDFFAKAVNYVLVKTLRPWKQRLTQNLPFALANAVVRDAFNAIFMSKDGVKGMLPSFYMTRAAFNNYFPESWLNKIGLNKYDSPTQGELLSQSLNATHHKTQLSILESFYETVADGIYIEDWRNMSTAQKFAEIPGILSSLIGKPIDILNWGMGGKFASQKSETLSREGAYYAALDRGASQERALMEYDKITGNFAHHQPHSGLAMLIRQAGFLNAGLQITWGQMERWMQPSANATIGGTPIPYLSKNQTGMAIRLAAIASGATLAAAAKHALLSAWMDDDDYEEYVNNIREAPREHRLRKATFWFPLLGEFQLPFDYGIVGGFQSWGFNMAEDYIIGREGGSAKEKATDLLSRVKEGIPVVGGGWTDLLHPLAKTVQETQLGESGFSYFYGDHIVPPYLVDNELDPSERAFADTPTIYKWIGKQTGTSPLKVQYVTRSLLTAAADDTAYLIDKVKDGKDVSVKDVPSLKRIFAKPYTGFNSESVQRLQELDKEWQLAGQKINNAVKRGDLSPAEINTLKEQRARLDRAHFAWEMSEDLWKNAKEARLQDKMDVYDQTTKDMTKLAQSFMRWYDSGKTGLTPTMAEFATDDTKTALVYGALENLSTESDRDKSDENDWLISNRREMVKELGLTYEQSLELLNQKWLAEDQEAENKLAFKKGRDPKTIQLETRTEGRYAGAIRKLTDARVNRLKRLQEIYSNE